GYLAEMDGDTESAKDYYARARRSGLANARVGYATQQSAEGKKLFEVADENDQKMDDKMARLQAARRRQAGPVVLRRRDNTPVQPQVEPVQQEPSTLGPPQPQVPQLTPQSQQPQTPQQQTPEESPVQPQQ